MSFLTAPLVADTIPGSAVNRWPIKDGSGTTIKDVIGSDDGTFDGNPQWKSVADAIQDYELSFDGNDGVDTPADSPSGSCTLLVTINFDGDVTTMQRLHSYMPSSGTTGIRNLRFNNSGTNLLEFEVGDDSGNVSDVTHTLSSTGRYRVAAILDAGVPELKLAVNGSVKSTEQISGGFTTQVSSHSLGYLRRGNSEYYAHNLDEPMTGNEAYSSQQLTDDYNRQPWS